MIVVGTTVQLPQFYYAKSLKKVITWIFLVFLVQKMGMVRCTITVHLAHELHTDIVISQVAGMCAIFIIINTFAANSHIVAHLSPSDC